MDVSIIIINYNTQKMTSECIDYIIKETKDVNYEIILVDNASTDGSKEYFENDSRIRYIYNERNAGFGAANNIGMKQAKGKYYFLLNSDTIVLNNAIKSLYEYAETNEKRACYGCYLEHKNGGIHAPAVFFPRLTLSEFIKDKIHPRSYDYDINKPMNVEVVSGTDIFVHRSVIDEVGGFDENIFLYGEECEWAIRLKQHNIPRILIPGPRIIHLGGGSIKKKRKQAFTFVKINKYESHFYILKKYMNPFVYYLARIYYAIMVTCSSLPKAFLVDKSYFVAIKQVFVRIK